MSFADCRYNMRKVSMFLVAGLFAFGSSDMQFAGELDKPTGDIGLSQKILHTWVVYAQWPPASVPNHLDGTITFAADGHFVAEGIFTIVNDKQPLQFEGTWQVKDGFLIETVTKSNSRVVPVGEITRDKIVRVNDKEWVYQTGQGKTVTRKRKPDA